MSFTKLPAELQIQVFSYLSNRDLKSVRAVNIRCRDNASVWLFRSIIACARYQAMGVFQKISLHPVYQNYVKEIVFDATEYDRVLAENEKAYHRLADRHKELKNVVSWHRHTKFKKYQLLYKEQEEIKQGVLVQTIAKALEWMPHIHSIVYCALPRHIPVEKKDMQEILPRGIVDRRIMPQGDTSESLENGFHHLIGAIAMARYNKIREFRVERYPASTWPLPISPFQFEHFLFSHPTYLESGKYFFHNLTSVDLAFTYQHGAAIAQESLVNMHVLLREIKDLRRIRIHMPRSATRFANPNTIDTLTDPHSFATFGLNTQWEHLQCVDLQGLYASEQQLKKLVAWGKHTLESIKFSFCILSTGKWSNMVEEIVYGTSIKEFVLDHVNESYVGDVLFRELPELDAAPWSYEGQVELDDKGERFFHERAGKFVYAWRNLLTELD